MDKIRGLLIDLSGTIHIENEVIPGAIEAVKQLRKSGLPFKFVTNTTKESQAKLVHRLESIGFDIRSNEIFSSLSAATDYLKHEELRPKLLLDDRAMEDFADFDTRDPNAVVIGLAPEKFNYDTLNDAFRMIQGGAKFIAIHKARFFKTTDGLALGPGCFVTGLEYCTGSSAVVLGKPEQKFFLAALNRISQDFGIKLAPKDVLMVGDDILDDVLGAQNAGFQGCLVKTGKYREGDESRFDEKSSPNFVRNSFSEVLSEIINSQPGSN